MSGSKVLPLRESPTNPKSVDVYLEIGPKRTFAGALDWPAWCRYGRNEEEALAALFEYVPRYARVLSGTRLGFTAPEKIDRLCVVERLEGNATTDFGAINVTAVGRRGQLIRRRRAQTLREDPGRRLVLHLAQPVTPGSSWPAPPAIVSGSATC